jgi:cytochrome b561
VDQCQADDVAPFILRIASPSRSLGGKETSPAVMQLFNTPTRYGVISQGLHWTAVALVVVAWTLGILGDELPRGTSRALGLYVHTTAGLLVVALTILRLLWRLVDPSPAAEKTPFDEWLFADWIGLGAKLAHFGLYLLLVAVPVAGIVLQFARGDSLPIFGIVEVTSPWARDRAFAEGVKEVHELLAHGLLALAGLHAAAAMVHHWVFRDRTLVRMLPGSKPGR